MLSFDVENDWLTTLKNVLCDKRASCIDKALSKVYEEEGSVYPEKNKIFEALKLTSFSQTKVIILGQDPYHKKNQAMGLSFSVPKTERIPPSLKNIYKEIGMEYPSFRSPPHGDLTNWAKQGVLLLNSTLTVFEGLPNSHRKLIDWEWFTDSIIKALSSEKDNLVFLLWGNFAKEKARLIDCNKHLVLKASHPSPLARGAFFGCEHFIKTNEYLQSNNKSQINW